jgi:hypothetical protein
MQKLHDKPACWCSGTVPPQPYYVGFVIFLRDSSTFPFSFERLRKIPAIDDPRLFDASIHLPPIFCPYAGHHGNPGLCVLRGLGGNEAVWRFTNASPTWSQHGPNYEMIIDAGCHIPFIVWQAETENGFISINRSVFVNPKHCYYVWLLGPKIKLPIESDFELPFEAASLESN